MFGGSTAFPATSGSALQDSWVWNSTNGYWSEVTAATPTVSNTPAKRYLFGMAFDTLANATFLFGGTGSSLFNDIWRYAGSWTSLTIGAPNPSLTAQGVMTFDPTRGLTMLVGESSSGMQTWTSNGSSWTNATSAATPSARTMTSIAYDTARSTAVLYAGNSGTGVLDDLWEAPSGVNRRPGVIAQFDFGAAGAIAPTITKVIAEAFAGGVGNTLNPAGTGSTVNGAAIAAWDAWSGVWVEGNSNSSGTGSYSALGFEPLDANAPRYLLPTNQTINIALYPNGTLGNGLNLPQVDVDYVELTVQYQQ